MAMLGNSLMPLVQQNITVRDLRKEYAEYGKDLHELLGKWPADARIGVEGPNQIPRDLGIMEGVRGLGENKDIID